MHNRRKQLKMTQEMLGEKTGINRLQIGRIEKGNYIPSLPQLELIAGTLDFSIGDILIEDSGRNVFVDLKGQAETPEEEAAMDEAFDMILCLNKQRIIRSRLIND